MIKFALSNVGKKKLCKHQRMDREAEQYNEAD